MTEIGTPDPTAPEIEILPRTTPVPEPIEIPEVAPAPTREPVTIPA